MAEVSLKDWLHHLPFSLETQVCEPLVKLADRLDTFVSCEATPDPLGVRTKALLACRAKVMQRIMQRVQLLLSLPGEGTPKLELDPPFRLQGNPRDVTELREILRRELEDAVERAVVVAGLWEYALRDYSSENSKMTK